MIVRRIETGARLRLSLFFHCIGIRWNIPAGFIRIPKASGLHRGMIAQAVGGFPANSPYRRTQADTKLSMFIAGIALMSYRTGRFVLLQCRVSKQITGGERMERRIAGSSALITMDAPAACSGGNPVEAFRPGSALRGPCTMPEQRMQADERRTCAENARLSGNTTVGMR